MGTVAAMLGNRDRNLMLFAPETFPAALELRRQAFRIAGQKRWHAILGLTFGLGAVTWAFKGMLDGSFSYSERRERSQRKEGSRSAWLAARPISTRGIRGKASARR